MIATLSTGRTRAVSAKGRRRPGAAYKDGLDVSDAFSCNRCAPTEETFWARRQISAYVPGCIAAFVRHGHRLVAYSYDPIEKVQTASLSLPLNLQGHKHSFVPILKQTRKAARDLEVKDARISEWSALDRAGKAGGSWLRCGTSFRGRDMRQPSGTGSVGS